METLVHTLPLAPPDEQAARRTLRGQIAGLESELAGLFASAWPRAGFDWDVRGQGGGPRLLSLAELEQVRDRLVRRVGEARRALHERGTAEEEARRRIEAMMLDPAAHKWEIVRHSDIGEPGCHQWHVRPRLGLIGMLMGWWRVVISSGCPLAWPPSRPWYEPRAS